MAGEGRLTSATRALLADVGDLPPARGYLVALSGGADSAVAAWAVAALAGVPAVRSVFVDHGLPASQDLGEAAAKVAAHLGIELAVEHIDVPPGPNWEERARNERRVAVRRAAHAGELIVTGHHADDQAETVLGNLLRGAGARGLGGMVRLAEPWFRPLLQVPRSRVRDAADELGLPYLDDPANADAAYTRNLLRHHLLPTLDRWRPGVRAGLVRSAAHLAADDAYLEAAVDGSPVHLSREAWHVPIPLLATLPEPLAVRLLRRAVALARPPHPPSTNEVGRLMDVATGRSRRAELTGGLVAEREGPYLTLHRPGEALRGPDPAPLRVPGSVVWGEWEIEASVGATSPIHIGPGIAAIDAGLVPPTLEVRAGTAADALDIANGSKRVTRALAEGGIPARRRPGWPVVTAGGKIVWVVGVRVASWCRPSSTTTRWVVLRTGTPWRT